MAGTSPFLGDPGPQFDPKQAGEPPPAAEPDGGTLHALPPAPDMWEEESVRAILRAKGSMIHAVAGVADEDWLYTAADLQAISPPLTRILNRYDATRAAAGTADELAVMIGLGGYASRSWRERRAALATLEQRPPEPVSGVGAPAGTGPTPPPDFSDVPTIDPDETEVPWQEN